MSSISSISSIRRLPGARKVLSTRVNVMGRFLLSPGDTFDLAQAEQVIAKAKANRTRIRTVLKVFNVGMRLGERGIFAAMPAEFVEFSHLRALVSLPSDPATLAVCIGLHHQQVVIVVQFKSAQVLMAVVDEVGKQRNHATSRPESIVSATVQHRVAEWTHDRLDERSSVAFEEAEDPEYAVISKPLKEQQELHHHHPHQQQQEQQQQQQQQQLHRHHHHQPEYQPPPVAPASDAVDGSSSPCIDVEILNYDELGSLAVFESTDGPPTMLNEPLTQKQPATVRASGAYGTVSIHASRPLSGRYATVTY